MITPKKIISGVFTVAVIGLSLLAWSERQSIYDWYRLRGYEPPKIIAQLATDTTMNNSARNIFYVSHPSVEDKIGFNQHCPQGEKTIVLGCYIKNGGIYIYDVQDVRLKGVEQVTAAHELLHAAYDRLDEDEKENVIALIKTAYAKVTDPRIRKNINSYQKAGADINDELHSILGTEVRDLPAALESYYQRYFHSRVKIVEYSEGYEQVFSANQAKISQLSSQINALKKSIKSLEQKLTAERASLENDRGSVTTQAQANSFNQRVDSYNNSVAYLNQLVSQHNSLVREYQQTAIQQQELYKAISSDAAEL